MFGKLSEVAEDRGFTVQVTPEIEGHPGANGLSEFGAKRLTVAGNRSPKQRVKSLAHEVGHMLMHEPPASAQRDITRSQCEQEAESTAYVACKTLGLDTDDYSFGYVTGWTGGDKDKTQAAIKGGCPGLRRT